MRIEDYIIENIDKDFSGDMPFPVKQKTIEKGTIITDYNEEETKVYFLNKGIAQVLFQDGEEEKVLDFFFEGVFFCSYSAYLLNETSTVQISTLTDCVLEEILLSDLQSAYSHSLLANQLGRFATEFVYVNKVLIERDLRTLTAEERYKKLLASKGEWINRISNKKIAQYLGIRPESLSRIRKKLIS